MNLEAEAEKIRTLQERIGFLETSVKEEKLQVKAAGRQLDHTQAAQEVLQLLAQAVQQQAHSRISKIVSSCLSQIFDDPYELNIEFDRKRGRTEARLRFVRRGLDVDPLTASGGGMVDVAAFALRVACLMLHRPRLGKVVVIDEGFKFVSAQYRENVRAMLEQLSRDLKIQIVQVTHSSEYEVGKIVEIS